MWSPSPQSRVKTVREVVKMLKGGVAVPSKSGQNRRGFRLADVRPNRSPSPQSRVKTSPNLYKGGVCYESPSPQSRVKTGYKCLSQVL